MSGWSEAAGFFYVMNAKKSCDSGGFDPMRRRPSILAPTVSVLLGAVGLASPAAAAEDGPTPDRALSYPNAVQLDLGLAVVGLAYERLFERHVAVQFEAHIFGTWFGPIFDLPNLSGLGGQIRPSIFVRGEGARGMYVSPFLRLDRVTAEAGGVKGSDVGYSAGVFLGYAFVFFRDERASLRIGAGLQTMQYVVDLGSTKKSFETLFPALDLVLGYAF
jgi:hypothetical protein